MTLKKERDACPAPFCKKEGKRFRFPSKGFFVIPQGKMRLFQDRRWGRPNPPAHLPTPCRVQRRYRDRPARDRRHTRRHIHISWGVPPDARRLLEVALQQTLLVLASFISFASAQAPKLTHSAARPLQIKPASLGFDLAAAYLKYLSSKPFNALP